MLVGHSYGGAVISVATADTSRVKAVVYIAAFVPAIGESALELTDTYPGSTLAQATCTQYYPLPGGGQGWKKLPSWCLVATEDRNIPPAALQWMAERARAHTVRVRAPHAVAVSDPGPVTELILRAARSTR